MNHCTTDLHTTDLAQAHNQCDRVTYIWNVLNSLSNLVEWCTFEKRKEMISNDENALN